MAAESTGTGKWAEPGVPHRGWACTDIDDVEDDLELCQMCEAREVRFVHVMVNPRYAGELRVGRVCAGHMEGDAAAAQAREGAFKNEGARRRNWLTRRWRTSAAGNDFIKTDGFHVTVYRRGSGWGARVTHTASGHSVPSRSAYTTSDAVKLAAFDKMLALKAEQPWLDTRTPRTAGRPDGLRGRPT